MVSERLWREAELETLVWESRDEGPGGKGRRSRPVRASCLGGHGGAIWTLQSHVKGAQASLRPSELCQKQGEASEIKTECGLGSGHPSGAGRTEAWGTERPEIKGSSV